MGGQVNKITMDKNHNRIIEAIKSGANSVKEIALETGIDYQEVLDWCAKDDNMQLMDRLSYEPIWKAKKKILESSGDDKNDAKWLLTHHKASKTDWSDRVEHTGKDGKDLIPTPILNGITNNK